MKLSIIYPVMNQHELTQACIDTALHNLSGKNDVEFVVLDNGSDKPIELFGMRADFYRVPLPAMAQATHEPIMKDSPSTTTCDFKMIRYPKSIGVYPTFWQGLQLASRDSEVLAFFHSDLAIAEKDWDVKLLNAFESDPTIGLIGFIGSNEIDWYGGRGAGTASNFQGGTVTDGNRSWTGSPAEAHGKRITGLYLSAVVDGCSMVFRRSCLEQIAQRPEFPPHHFYDRLLSCETREVGYKVATLGVACDHISGQTVNQEQKYQTFASEWAVANNVPPVMHEDGKTPNWDATVYQRAEKMWLDEYRDQKHLIPIKV